MPSANTNPLTLPHRLLTADDIAAELGISRIAVVKKASLLEPFFETAVSRGGRPQKMYRAEVLEVLAPSSLRLVQPGKDAVRVRAERADKGTLRKITPEMDAEFAERARQIYLNQPIRRAVYEACLRAAEQLWCSSYSELWRDYAECADYFYKRRIKRKDNYFTGYYYRTPDWEQQWEFKWKKSDHALINVPTSRYSWLDLGESADVLREGFGAATIWFIDDHTSDVFVRDETRVGFKGVQPKGIYMICGWTGMPLDFIAGEPNSVKLIALILRNVMRYGLPYAIGLENSRVMASANVDGAITALYSEEALGEYLRADGWFHKLWPRATSPVVRNLPNDPRAPGKARMERFFREFKRGDALAMPETYQDGGIDRVQLRLGTPAAPPRDYTEERYFANVTRYLSTRYLDTNRPAMFPGAHRLGIRPTVREVWNYYGGETNPGTGIAPDPNRFAYCLYWLATALDTAKPDGKPKPITKTVVKAHPGRVVCKKDHREYQFVHASLVHLRGHKVAVVFIPDDLDFMRDERDSDYAALFLVDDPKRPQLLGVCRDNFTRNIEDAERNRRNVIEVRRVMNDDLKAITGAPATQTAYNAIEEAEFSLVGEQSAPVAQIGRGKEPPQPTPLPPTDEPNNGSDDCSAVYDEVNDLLNL